MSSIPERAEFDYRKRVLVVDDNADARETLASCARECGYDAATADSGATALSMIEASSFDVVVADIVMVGLSGIELARRLRDARPEITVVLVTGYEEYADAAASIGALPLLKPVTMSTLALVLQDAVDAAEAARRG